MTRIAQTLTITNVAAKRVSVTRIIAQMDLSPSTTIGPSLVWNGRVLIMTPRLVATESQLATATSHQRAMF